MSSTSISGLRFGRLGLVLTTAATSFRSEGTLAIFTEKGAKKYTLIRPDLTAGPKF
jgi:hypothetical protein